jgi:hypothetical protein
MNNGMLMAKMCCHLNSTQQSTTKEISEQQQARSTTTNIAIANGTGTTLTSRCRIQQDEEATIYYYYYYATSYYNTTINNKMNNITYLLETMHWQEIGALSPSHTTHLFLLLSWFVFLLCCV